jgi:hypothetical protein
LTILGINPCKTLLRLLLKLAAATSFTSFAKRTSSVSVGRDLAGTLTLVSRRDAWSSRPHNRQSLSDISR